MWSLLFFFMKSLNPRFVISNACTAFAFLLLHCDITKKLHSRGSFRQFFSHFFKGYLIMYKLKFKKYAIHEMLSIGCCRWFVSRLLNSSRILSKWLSPTHSHWKTISYANHQLFIKCRWSNYSIARKTKTATRKIAPTLPAWNKPGWILMLFL